VYINCYTIINSVITPSLIFYGQLMSNWHGTKPGKAAKGSKYPVYIDS